MAATDSSQARSAPLTPYCCCCCSAAINATPRTDATTGKAKSLRANQTDENKNQVFYKRKENARSQVGVMVRIQVVVGRGRCKDRSSHCTAVPFPTWLVGGPTVDSVRGAYQTLRAQASFPPGPIVRLFKLSLTGLRERPHATCVSGCDGLIEISWKTPRMSRPGRMRDRASGSKYQAQCIATYWSRKYLCVNVVHCCWLRTHSGIAWDRCSCQQNDL